MSQRLQSTSRRHFLGGWALACGLWTTAVREARGADLSGTSNRPESELTRALRSRRFDGTGILIDFPRLADSGYAVDFTVTVQADGGRRISQLEVVLPENPNPSAVKLRLPQGQTQFRFSTRLRLAASQEAWAIVTFDDGSVRAASAPTVITSSACLDES